MFATHKGLFRYKRLMFGISSALEKYQQVIQQVLHDCSGTANISDDIIIFGPDTDEHDRRLEQVLVRLKEKGLTLNKEKCVFHMPKLTFMGLVLSQRGIAEEKVKAVTETREPQNASEVKSFLGLVNFNARFRPCHCRRTTKEANKKRRTIRFWSSTARGIHRTETEDGPGRDSGILRLQCQDEDYY